MTLVTEGRNMTRIKTLGLALVAALALCAVAGAATASAGYYVVTGGGGFTAQRITQQYTQPGGIAADCPSGGAFAGSVAYLDKSLGGVPSDLSCTSSNEGAVSWKWNGCAVNLQPGNDGDPLMGTLSISGCGSVQLNSASCEKRIAPQSIPARFYNESGSVRVTAEGTLYYSVVKSGGFCKNGVINYTGEWKVFPYNGGWIGAFSGKVGLFHAGNQFSAETPAYPVSVSGSQVPSEHHNMTLPGGRQLRCESIELSGSLSGPSATIDLAPQYTNCELYIGETVLPATVDASACDYRLGSGALSILCQSESDAIVISGYMPEEEAVPLCVYRVTPQSGLSSVETTNVGAGAEAGVQVQFSVSNISVTRASGRIGTCGAVKTTSTYSGSSVLYGVME